MVIASPVALVPHLRPQRGLYPLIGALTIRISPTQQPTDPAALALQALGFILADERRAQRFLDLTGLTPDSLRAALTEESTHRAVIDFLCAHEPDLVAAAEALGITPQHLLGAFGQEQI